MRWNGGMKTLRRWQRRHRFSDTDAQLVVAVWITCGHSRAAALANVGRTRRTFRGWAKKLERKSMRELFDNTAPSPARRLRYRLAPPATLPPRLAARFFVTEALLRGSRERIDELGKHTSGHHSLNTLSARRSHHGPFLMMSTGPDVPPGFVRRT